MTSHNKTPRALSQELGTKLSEWTYAVSNYFDICKDKQEQLFELIRLTEDPQSTFGRDELGTIREALSYMLSLSFVVLREKQQVDDFYNDYNGF